MHSLLSESSFAGATCVIMPFSSWRSNTKTKTERMEEGVLGLLQGFFTMQRQSQSKWYHTNRLVLAYIEAGQGGCFWFFIIKVAYLQHLKSFDYFTWERFGHTSESKVHSPQSLGCEKDEDIKGQSIISISGSIFLFWEFTRIALNDSKFKIILLYHILDLGAAP